MATPVKVGGITIQKNFWQSKRFILSLIAVLGVTLSEAFGIEMPPEKLATIALTVLGFVGFQTKEDTAVKVAAIENQPGTE